MESRIKIEANRKEMSNACAKSKIFNIRYFEELSAGLFKATVRHRELPKNLEGTYTIPELNELLSEPVNPQKENDQVSEERTNFLTGNYVLLTTYATVRNNVTETEGETQTAAIAIEQDFLTEYAKSLGFQSLQEFLDDYIYDSVMVLADLAEEVNALAFSYASSADEPFYFPETIKGSAMLAFADFLSGKLQEQGFEEASKTIDTMLDL